MTINLKELCYRKCLFILCGTLLNCSKSNYSDKIELSSVDNKTSSKGFYNHSKLQTIDISGRGGKLYTAKGVIEGAPTLMIFTEGIPKMYETNNINEAIVPIINGDAIIAWRATQFFNDSTLNCELFGRKVLPEGTPKIISNLKPNTQYNFMCENKYGKASLTIKTVNFYNQSISLSKKIPIDVFLIAGQSNAGGQGKIIGQQYRNTIEPIMRFVDSNFEGINYIGAWPIFASTYLKKMNHGVVLVSSEVGGTGSNKLSDSGGGHWGPEGTLYSNSVNNLKLALSQLSEMGYSANLKGILWVQGENDAIALEKNIQTIEDYKVALNNIINQFHRDLGLNVPFFIFQTGAHEVFDISFKQVREVQENILRTMPSTYLVYNGASTFLDRNLMWDAYHYKPLAYSEMGKMGAEEVVNILNGDYTNQPLLNASKNSCSVKIENYKSVFSIEDNIEVKWSGRNEVGRLNRLIGNENTNTNSNLNDILSFGSANGKVTVLSNEISKSITPLLLKNENISVEYVIYEKILNSWSSCNQTVKLTWFHPQSGDCEIPDSIESNCGGKGTKVFRGGVCKVTNSLNTQLIGKYFICNKNLQWQEI